MSNIEKLLKGVEVEWKTLGEIAEIGTGSHDTQDAVEDGNYIFYARGREPLRLNMFDFDEIAIITAGDGVGVGKVFHYAQGKYALHQRAYRIAPRKRINPRFVYHYISANFYAYVQKTSVNSSVSSLRRPMFLKFPIPIPSFEMQTEIARILDKFSTLTAELQAELQARKSQYEYYRNQLLTYPMEESGQPSLRSSRSDTSIQNGDNPTQPLSTSNPHTGNSVLQPRDKVEWKTLDSIAENLDSMRKPVTSGSRETGDIPYYGASGIVDYVKDFIFDGDFLLISEDGANLVARNTPIAFSISGRSWVNNHAHVLKFRTYTERRFVEYYLNSIDLTPHISGAAQPKLNQRNLNSIKIPIPSLEEQERIVSILDKFNTITTSVTEGLPKEIELRQKQYEYYRDMLLTFPTDNIKA